ncbi:MAG: AAA family ATPase [Deltaproteobacteria bacterium]|nr:AAA family ATPase [Deltaproteobacteria bacterium]
MASELGILCDFARGIFYPIPKSQFERKNSNYLVGVLPSDLKKNIAITGFMAVGKSAVGRKLAKRLKRPFVDLDLAIERREGKPVAEIFALKGEAYFRQVEKETLREVLKLQEQVIATGGGAVMDEENLRLLKSRALLICLTASPERLLKRSGRKPNRPLLEKPDRLKRIEELLGRRQQVYREAHISVDTDQLPVPRVVDEIIKALDQTPAGSEQETAKR